MDDELPTTPLNQSPYSGDSDDVWLVSYADDDDRELNAEQIARALASGEIFLTTIVWRDGMTDWKPIVEVPELRSVVQRQQSRRKRSTVMGGFGTPHPPRPAARPPTPAPSPRPPAAAPRPATAPQRAAAPTPAPARPGALHSASAKQPAAADDAPVSLDPDSLEEMSSNVLESAPEQPVSLRFRSQMATLTGGEESLDEPISEAPVSLTPEALESLPPEALEAASGQSSSGRGLFDIDLSDTDDNAGSQEAATVVRPRAERAGESILAGSGGAPPPSIRVFSPDAQLRAPRAPLRATSRAPTPKPAESEQSPSIDIEPPLSLPTQKSKGGVGKFVIAVLLLGAVGAAFYMGRRTANAPEAMPVPPPAEPVAAEAVKAAALVDPIPSPSVAEEASEEPEAEAEDESEAEAKETTQVAARPSPRPAPPPRTSPAPRPAPEPAPKPEPVKAPEEKKPEPKEEEPAAAGPFDRDAAAAALQSAAARASACRTDKDPSGVAQVSVTFSPSGRATNATVQGPPFAGTTTGGCIASKMRTARIPPFTGSRVVVKKQVVIH